MQDDRVRQEPSRTSEQKGFLRSLLSHLRGRFHSNQPENELIDYFVTTVEPKLRQVRGYRKRLQEPLQICREHSKALVAQIPGPICLKKSGYYDNPVIKAAFAGSDRIEDLLDRVEMTTSQTALPGTERVALLTMTSTEKTIFGSKKQGNMLIADAAMRCITFTDHNMVGLATTLADSREALEKFCLEIIAEAAARELSEIRTRLVDLRQRKEWLRAMNKMFGGGKGVGMGCIFVPFDPEKQKKQKELEKMLMETEIEISAASSGSETPENWLTIVENFISRPEDILNLQLVSLRLNWCNVLTDDPDEQANTITFVTFTLADEMQREGVLVAYELE
jgi:hypothetical protein